MFGSIRIVPDRASLARTGAELFARLALEAVEIRGTFRAALAGGSTPRDLYEALAAGTASGERPLPWSDIQLYWGDERHVPPDHPESNYRMVKEALLTRVPIPGANIHRIRGEEPDPRIAAAHLEAELIETFGLAANESPRFDLILLGMGADGHTASLFPGSAALESRRLAEAVWVEPLSTHRITLTPRVINNARCVVFLVAGTDKAETLRLVLGDEVDPRRFPAQIVRPVDGDCLWLADAAAARRLPSSGREGTPA